MAVVAIVGRPNVGKSSLFNRLISLRKRALDRTSDSGSPAIVDGTPGVTRDRLYGEVEWQGRRFYAIDTGGIMGEPSDFSEGIKAHVLAALEECDAILMVLDGRAGVTPPDEEVARLLRKGGKPVVVVANKLDDPGHDDLLHDAWTLGFENVVGVSALHKRNLDGLLDLLSGLLPKDNEDEERESEEVRLAIVGRPNVGKSSLLNRLAGEERALVSPVAGTTRDPVDTSVTLAGRRFRLVDTAGLRRRRQTGLEYYALVRTLAAVDRSDVALLVMDAEAPCTDQDKKIAAHVVERGKGLILVLNKWDLTGGERPGDTFTKQIRDAMPFLSWAPILFTSALSRRGIGKLGASALSVWESRRRRIPTNALNRLMRDVLAFDRLPSNRKGRALRIYYCSQTGIEPPTFVFFVNDPSIVNTAFENHVRRELRALEDFTGSPLRIFWRGKDEEK